MRYAYVNGNDIVNGNGVCVSFFVQGCPHRCKGCFNPETWSFDSGKLYTEETKWEIIKSISANGIQRNFSILGGEPLDPRNLDMVNEVLKVVRTAYPDIEIVLWTGYRFEELNMDSKIDDILKQIDYLVDGPFIEEEKNLDLKWRGSNNQHIWGKGEGQWMIIE